MGKNLYTVIVDYQGGSYVMQVTALDEISALRSWAKGFHKENYLKGRSKYIANNVLKNIDVFPPEALNGVESTWHHQAYFKDEIASIHIVKTMI